MKKRAVVTGIGILSNIGNDKQTVSNSLKNGKSGLRQMEAFKEVGMLSQIAGPCMITTQDQKRIDRKHLRFMEKGTIYGVLSALDALEDAGLSKEEIAQKPRIGNISATGGVPFDLMIKEHDALMQKGFRFTSPFAVPKIMNSALSANIANTFSLHGPSITVSAACSSSTHAIGIAFEQITQNKQDVVLAVGAEEPGYEFAFPFDSMKAMSRNFNDTPAIASRPYDKDRDGFVIAGGGATLIVEELEHAKKRNAHIYAEIIGYGSGSDGVDMVQPSPEGAKRCMLNALEGIDNLSEIDYINTHGTSTPVGDLSELRALKKTFGDNIPKLSSTKSMTGHSLGACGAQEAVYCLLMMDEQFIAPSINIDHLDEEAKGFPIVQKTIDAQLKYVMTNNFGFGGNNSCLVFRKI